MKIVTLRKIAFAFLLAVICVASIFVTSASSSSYATCRKAAMGIKGYAVWNHERTTDYEQTSIFLRQSNVYFSDGYNTLTCEAIGLGPFWFTKNVWQTLVGCLGSLENGGEMCPQDYFGVYP